jgi:hypothetical protein|tara:strand:+ start:541 stop:648 length:108 start_codon:yes stop_codon:yes gene_type:complete
MTLTPQLEGNLTLPAIAAPVAELIGRMKDEYAAAQ